MERRYCEQGGTHESLRSLGLEEFLRDTITPANGKRFALGMAWGLCPFCTSTLAIDNESDKGVL